MSHETIYRSLYIQARGALKKELLQHLTHPGDAPLAQPHAEDARSWPDHQDGLDQRAPAVG